VHLGCLYDDPRDAQHIGFLETQCETLCCLPLHPRLAKLRSLAGFLLGEPLTLAYFRDGGLQRWVDATIAAYRPQRIFVFSSAMAPYVDHHAAEMRVLDMVDVDSDKWRQYAPTKTWPLSAVYAREQRKLAAFERKAAGAFTATLLVSRAEAAVFASFAPAESERVLVLRNGIDTAQFDPDRAYDNPYGGPYGGPDPVLVFTGAMDYWPNIEGVSWFAHEILPLLRARWPALEFWIVGINPAPAVRRLADHDGVHVTGRVEDIRPYLHHAAAVVVPLRIARGIQNKVLEAMAMARPVVLTPAACEGIEAKDGDEVLVAGSADAFAERVASVLAGAFPLLGARARARVTKDYQWSFTILDEIMEAGKPALAVAGGER
jgi:sugar transferase (PEP-CTERM/EpsH1 system associated)